jgi:hypothetical protein
MMAYATSEDKIAMAQVQLDLVGQEVVVTHREVQFPLVGMEFRQGERDIPTSFLAVADDLDECMVIFFGGT